MGALQLTPRDHELLRVRDPELLRRAAFQVLCRLRWGEEDPTCPNCGGTSPYWLRVQRIFSCPVPWCRFTFSPLTFTAMHVPGVMYYTVLTALTAYEVMGEEEVFRDLGAYGRIAGLGVHGAASMAQRIKAAGGPEMALLVQQHYLVDYRKGKRHAGYSSPRSRTKAIEGPKGRRRHAGAR